MPEAERTFEYVAIDANGRRQKGALQAFSDAAVYAQLRRDGLAPVRIRAVRARDGGREAASLTDRECAEILSNLAELLRAGADMRSAVGILAERSDRPALRAVCRKLIAEISGGDALEQVFSRNLSAKQTFVAALIAAGEAGGDLPGSFQRASEMLESRIKLREQIFSIMAHPAFVLVSTLAAMAIILLFVVPSLAPLAADSGAPPPPALGLLIGMSTFLRAHGLLLGAGALTSGICAVAAWRAGWLAGPLDRLLLNGPTRRTAGGLVFGGFAIALGGMLAGGAPMSDALRLAIRAVGSPSARSRLEPVAQAVWQGESLSGALQHVSAFPAAIVRLAAVGEASGSLGALLLRAGKLEEAAAIRRIEAAGRLLGPILIVGLGAMIGLLMAGLLSGVTELGQSALQ
jgi:type II secretory pathway component PulF